MVAAASAGERRGAVLELGGWGAVFVDDGCEVAPSCLACPLPVCRYDDGGALLRAAAVAARTERNRAMVAAVRSGERVTAVARRFGVSRRTVLRACAVARLREQAEGLALDRKPE